LIHFYKSIFRDYDIIRIVELNFVRCKINPHPTSTFSIINKE